MTTWPSGVAPQSFVGKELETICLSRHSISFVFVPDLVIQVFQSFSHTSGGKSARVSLPLESPQLCHLIGSVIDRAAVRNDELTLYLNSGSELTFHVEGGYEAYHLQMAGQTHIIA